MSDSASSRRPKTPTQNPRAPLFEMRDEPLRQGPQPLKNLRDPFEDLPEVRPRTGRRSERAPTQPLPVRRNVDDSDQPAPQRSARGSLIEASADLHRAQMLGSRIYDAHPSRSFSGSGRPTFGLFHEYPWLILLVGAACLVIFLLASSPSRTIISRYGGLSSAATVANSQAAAPPPVPNGEHSLLIQGRPKITADMINAVLTKYGSPAMGTGQVWIDLGERYGIDPAYALAFFIHESSAGTNPRWDGMKPDGSTTHNIGNISCAGYSRCLGRWRDYDSWQEGIEDWYRLIANEYVRDRGTSTIEQIIPIYAPSFENDVNAYVQSVVQMVDGWNDQGVSQ